MQGSVKTPETAHGKNCGKVVDIFWAARVCITFHTMPIRASKQKQGQIL
jgi:hypothetical protein